MEEYYDDEIVYEGKIEDRLAELHKKMSELDETSEEYRKLSEIYVKMHTVYNQQTRIDNEAKAKKRQQKLEEKQLKKEKKQKKHERKLKEQELKNQRRIALITSLSALVAGALTAGASVYSTRQNRKNLEDTLYFEKTGIPRSSGHKYVSKKG
jgi:hypothetical protein